MSEDIHNDDELFRKAYNNYEEEPSPEAWEKLSARLDQKDAILYRAKFTWWKRIAVVLIFLLGTAMAYELFFKPGSSSSTPTADEKQLKPAADSALQQPSSNQIQPPNNTRDSLNQAEESVHSSPKQTTEEENQQTDNNTAANKELHTQATKQHILTNSTNITHKIVEEENVATRQPRQPGAYESDAAKAAQGSKQAGLNQSLKEDWAIADKKDKEEDKATLLNNSNNKNNDYTSTIQHSDSVLAIDKKPDSPKNNTTASNKKSPIKIKNLFKPHFSFSPYIAADFTGDQIDNDEHHRDPDRRDERHEIEDREDIQFSFSTGVLARYQFSRRLSVKSGLVYSTTSIHVGPGTLYATPDNNQSTAYKYVSSLGYAYVNPPFDQAPSIGDSIRCEQVEQHASYLGIPLMAGYTINAGKKLTIMPGIGFTTNLLLGANAQAELHKDNKESKVAINNMKGLAPVYFSFATDVELHYQLSNNFSLMLLPSFKHAINSTTSNHVVKTYPYNFGLGIGLTYGL